MAHTKLLCFTALSQRDDAWGFTLLHSRLLSSFTSTFSLKAVLAATKKTSANARFSNANGVLLISGNTHLSGWSSGHIPTGISAGISVAVL